MKIFLFPLVAAVSLVGFAQQDPQLTHFMFNKIAVNSAHAGLNGNTCFSTLARNQWAGFQGAPKTMALNFSMPLGVLGSGVGGTYYYDQLGMEQNQVVRLHYSKHFRVSQVGRLGVGMHVGFVGKSYKANWITPDGTLWFYDPAISSGQSKGMVPDLGFGLYFKHSKLYVGGSVTHFNEAAVTNMNLKLAKHYWVMAGYTVSMQGWAAKFNFLSKSDASSTQIDLNGRVIFRNKFWMGIAYRVQDAIAPMLGWQTPTKDGLLKVGVSYDATTSEIRQYDSGSFEAIIQYCFRKSTSIDLYDNPRLD